MVIVKPSQTHIEVCVLGTLSDDSSYTICPTGTSLELFIYLFILAETNSLMTHTLKRVSVLKTLHSSLL